MPARPRRAFTLLELLITITIIAVLVALIYPAAMMVRSQAKSVKCGSNLRQCMLAIVLYGQDNLNRLVPSKQYTASTGLSAAAYPNGVHWHDLIAPYVERDDTGWHANQHQAITWGCPAWQGAGDDGTGAYNPGYTGYGKSYCPLATADWHLDSQPDADAWGWPQGYTIFRLDNIPNQSKRILLGDSVQWQLFPDQTTRGNWFNWSGDPRRHRGNANYAFFDCHVKALDPFVAWDGVFGLEN
jgi:prepilin-type N-terminal cleavage/methylation domain-containing protein/prepilin-type processing-associated H-X9-DG protein